MKNHRLNLAILTSAALSLVMPASASAEKDSCSRLKARGFMYAAVRCELISDESKYFDPAAYQVCDRMTSRGWPDRTVECLETSAINALIRPPRTSAEE